jgi:predicted Zn-dependent peptidase
MNLSFYELLGDTNLVNKEVESFRAVSCDMIRDAANRYFTAENSTVLYYLSAASK